MHVSNLVTMLTIALCVSFLLRFSITTAETTTPLYNRTDYILLDCGSPSNTTSFPGRDWQADANSIYLPSNAETISNMSQASIQDPSITQQVPYITARIFHSQFTYTFSGLTTGPKFIRLYFYPSTYVSNLNMKQDSFFSVIANNYTLLSNFSAHLTLSSIHPSAATLVKEYIIHINDDRQLNITFKPSPNSFAFVNGIELVSIPDTLYYPGSDVQIKLVGQSTLFHIRNDTAFETAYRLNVGGRDVPVTEDTGMFRAWNQDFDYILGAATGFTLHRNVTVNYTSDAPPYTAPEIVYTSARYMNPNFSLNYNMTWYFPVDSGFYYLLRLHFCEFFLEVRESFDRVFTIFINNQTAEIQADVINWGNGRPHVAVKRDYVAYVADPDGSQGKQDLWLAMHPFPDAHPSYYNALLNGLEIFKLSNSSYSLAAPNPLPVSSPTTPEPSKVPRKKKNTKSWPLILAITGGVVLVTISFLGFLIFRRRKRVKDSATTSDTKSLWGPLSDNSRSTKTSGPGSTLPSDLCRHFSIEEIRSATGNFDNNFVIGVGGFGNVYKGFMDNGTTEVAIKRLNPSSNQGLREFLTEIEMLSKLRHLHLVSLIGYCDDNGEMILVYDYMARGTLRDHLYKTENPPLQWKQRLQICIGAAKGLHYLHTSANHMIIHRDVKSTNILVDEKWVAKVSDFGLSKMGPIVGTHTHVSTVVKGSFGYVDPEYYRRQQLTEKSDVYSFGVVLFEVLCARPAIIQNLPKEQANLAEWARQSYRKGTLYQILDPNLKDEIAPECLDKYVEIAFSCLKDKGIERPAMNDVVWSLEFALQLQEAAEKRGFKMGASDYNASPSLPLILHGEATTTDDDLFSRSGEAASSRSKSSVHFTSGSDGFKSETVFSEIISPSAR